MWARQTTITGDPTKIDEAVQNVRETIVPVLEGSQGFKGFTLLVDRDSGTCVGTAYFESRELLEGTEGAVRDAREQTAERFGGGTPQVRIFEVAIDTEA